MRSPYSFLALCSLALACGYNPQANKSGGEDGAPGGSVVSPDASGDGITRTVGIDVRAVDATRVEKREAGPGGSDAADAGRKEDVPAVGDGDAPISGTGGVGGVGGSVGTGGAAGNLGTGAIAGTLAIGGKTTNPATGGVGGAGGTTATLAPPVISSLSASPTPIGVGKSSTLSWATIGATRLLLEPGLGVVTGSTSMVVTPSKTSTYTLVAENAAGLTKKQVTVTVVESPTISRFVVSPEIISVGSKATLSVSFGGGEATVDHGVGKVISGADITVAPSETTTYTLTVTNAVEESKTATATVKVVPLPTISSFQAALTPIARGSSTTLTAHFDQGTGTIDQGIGRVISGTPVGTGALTAPRTYTLTVTNPAGDTKTATVSVTAVSPGNFGTIRTLKLTGGWHTATLLPNGKVLIAGGMNDTSEGHAELYDPATQIFVATGPMTSPRGRHTATLLANGKVLICGGVAGSNDSLSTAEIYDPATGKFVATGRLTSARAYHAAALLEDGTVLVAAGQGVGELRNGEIYDPSTGSFRAISASTTNAFTNHVVLSVPTIPPKVLVLGGNGGRLILNYEQATESFPSAGMMNFVRNWPGIALLSNNRVLLAGGMDEDLVVVKSAEVFDPGSQSSSVTGNMTVARAFPVSAVLEDGQVLVIGGQVVNGGDILASTELYSPTTGVFTASGSMAYPRIGHTATVLPNRKVLVVGGNTDSKDPGAELYFY